MIKIPLDVPYDKKEDYLLNYRLATYENRGMFVLAGDQRIEHLNKDFYGKDISRDDATPEHLFKIADQTVGIVLATQLGIIAGFAGGYRTVNFLVKLNSKTNLVKDKDPRSELLNTVSDVVAFQQATGLKIIGVGYTIYLGSEYEPKMLKTASEIIRQAHTSGLVVVLWIYPRGKAIKNPREVGLLAGACAVGGSLGADFIKIEFPEKNKDTEKFLQQALPTAGRCKIISAGGEAIKPKKYLKKIAKQIELGAFGVACGRNLHQKSLSNAVQFAKTIKAIVIEKKSLKDAIST